MPASMRSGVTSKEAKSDIKYLLRLAWGATAVIAVLVVGVPVALTLTKSSPLHTEPQGNIGPQAGLKPLGSDKRHRPWRPPYPTQTPPSTPSTSA